MTGGGEFRHRSSVGVGGDEEERVVLGKLQLDSIARKEEDSASVTTARSTELEEVIDGDGRDGGVRGVRGVLAVHRLQGLPARAPCTGRERETRRTRGTPQASSARSRTPAIRGGSGGQQPATRVRARILGALNGERGESRERGVQVVVGCPCPPGERGAAASEGSRGRQRAMAPGDGTVASLCPTGRSQFAKTPSAIFKVIPIRSSSTFRDLIEVFKHFHKIHKNSYRLQFTFRCSKKIGGAI